MNFLSDKSRRVSTFPPIARKHGATGETHPAEPAQRSPPMAPDGSRWCHEGMGRMTAVL